MHFLASGGLLASPPIRPDAPGLLSRQPAACKARAPPRVRRPRRPWALVEVGALFGGGRVGRRTTPRRVLFLKRLGGGVREVTCDVTLNRLSGPLGSILPTGAGVIWPTDTVARLWGNRGVGKLPGIPEGRRNRLVQSSRRFRSPSYTCAGGRYRVV